MHSRDLLLSSSTETVDAVSTREVVMTGPRTVELQDREICTEELKPSEMLIETEATFISAGTELSAYTALDPRVYQPGSWCAYPYRVGYANAGVVHRTGRGVTRVAVGDRVFTQTRHGSYVIADENRVVVPVPSGLAGTTAAAARMAGVALTAPLVSGSRGAPWVVVFGLGAVGNIAAQAYRILGCRVIGVDPVASRRAIAERCGIEFTLDPAEGSAAGAVRDITGGRMAGITVESAGRSSVIMETAKVTANSGQIILLGTPRAPHQADVTELLLDVHRRSIQIKGAYEHCLPVRDDRPGADSQMSKYRLAFNWIAQGALRLEPLITHVVKPQDVAGAYEGLLEQPQEYVGVAVDWS